MIEVEEDEAVVVDGADLDVEGVVVVVVLVVEVVVVAVVELLVAVVALDAVAEEDEGHPEAVVGDAGRLSQYVNHKHTLFYILRKIKYHLFVNCVSIL